MPLLENAATPEDPSRVINISSIYGVKVPLAEAYAYAASKAALIHLTRVMAGHLSNRNVTFNCVLPGPFESKMTKKFLDANKKLMISNIPLGRIGRSEDVAGTCIYLASKAGAFTNGALVTIDGESISQKPPEVRHVPNKASSQMSPQMPGWFCGFGTNTNSYTLGLAAPINASFGFGFGAAPRLPTNTLSSYVAASQPPTNSSALFGTAFQLSTNSSSLFGAAPQPPTNSSSLFGAAPQPPTNSPSLFGAASQTPMNSPSLFDAAPQPPTNSPSLFGAASQTPMNSPSLFGAAPQPPTNSPSLFGAAPQPPTTSPHDQENIVRSSYNSYKSLLFPPALSEQDCASKPYVAQTSSYGNFPDDEQQKVKLCTIIALIYLEVVMMKDFKDECDICYEKSKKALTTKFKDYNEENVKNVMDSVRKWMNDWIKE
ncbi:21626_t:CDS:2 [Entrophospora sp. SA101]|nr:21626_t:CDS:2 [Entrophospora sp. SA101]